MKIKIAKLDNKWKIEKTRFGFGEAEVYYANDFQQVLKWIENQSSKCTGSFASMERQLNDLKPLHDYRYMGFVKN